MLRQIKAITTNHHHKPKKNTKLMKIKNGNLNKKEKKNMEQEQCKVGTIQMSETPRAKNQPSSIKNSIRKPT